MKTTYVTITALCKELGVNKSKLHYFHTFGIIKPELIVSGKILVFDREKTISIVKEVAKLKKKGMTLEQIKTKLHEKNHTGKSTIS